MRWATVQSACIVLCALQLGGSCTPPRASLAPVSGGSLQNGTITDTITQGGGASKRYLVQFPTPNAATTSTVFLVTLVEEPQGLNTGGTFGWQRVAGLTSPDIGAVSFDLTCVNGSVVGDDPPGTTDPLAGCPQPVAATHCAATGLVGGLPQGPCSCVGWDGQSGNNPNSNLNDAHIHAQISAPAQPGIPSTITNTILVQCVSP